MKKRFHKTAVVSVLAVGLMLSMVGCGKKKQEEATTAEATVEVTEATTEEKEIGPEGKARSYLTGEWIDEELANTRPVAFMIENTSASIPSSNSSKADVYYEAPEEGGITRIMALYNDYTGMEEIGNIRSTRPYFVYTAIAFDAILSHCGGSIETYNELLDPGKVDNLDERLGALGYYRSEERVQPHNLYTNSEGIIKSIKDKGYTTTYPEDYEGYLKFTKDDKKEVKLKDGMDAAVVKVYQSDCKPWFEYNEEDGLYYRFEFGKAQMDKITDTQLAVKNVIIQECSVKAYFDEEDHDRVDVGIDKSGKGKYITNGKAIDITWKSLGLGKATQYFDADGNEIELNQGKTWINIMDGASADKNIVYATKEDYEANK